MPVSHRSEMENNGRKRMNAFSIESIIGKEPKKAASPVSRSVSRSPSVSPPLRRHPTSVHLPNTHMYTPHIATRIPPFSDLANVEYQRSLASLGLLPQSLPHTPSSLLHHIPQQLPHHHAAAQFHAAFIGSPHHRDSHLFPWLLGGRTDHLYGPRFTGHEAGLLLQPFRKAKRIRTAFSPSQLLKLEQSFDKNHYVVGHERKELASKLSLTETQVKVWFQNRRTKYKRLKYEEGGDKSPAAGTSASCDDDDDDLEIEADESDVDMPDEIGGNTSDECAARLKDADNINDNGHRGGEVGDMCTGNRCTTAEGGVCMNECTDRGGGDIEGLNVRPRLLHHARGDVHL